MSFRNIFNSAIFAVIVLTGYLAFTTLVPGIERNLMSDGVLTAAGQNFHYISYMLSGAGLVVLTYAWWTKWFVEVIDMPIETHGDDVNVSPAALQ